MLVTVWVQRRGDNIVHLTPQLVDDLKERLAQATLFRMDQLKLAFRKQNRPVREIQGDEYVETEGRQNAFGQMREAFHEASGQIKTYQAMGANMSRGAFARTKKSHFRCWCFEKIGGDIWLRIYLALGGVPAEVVGLVNEYIDWTVKEHFVCVHCLVVRGNGRIRANTGKQSMDLKHLFGGS